MKNEDLFYPEIQADIGSYSFDKGIEVEVYSSKASYFDWAKVSFTEELGEKVTLSKLDEAVVKLGYDGNLDDVFKGYVNDPVNTGGSSQNEIILKDDMIKLEETIITNTFLEATPQEILRYSLKKAGIQDYKLSSKVYPKKSIVPIFRKSVIDVIEEIHNLWRIKELFFFADKIFYWGEKPSQSKVYEFEYAVNIIDLTFADGLWELVTVSAPFIKHSQKIKVIHPSISGEFEVSKMVFSTTGDGFTRSKIYFVGDEAWRNNFIYRSDT
ncbi:serine/arginine repetitive matrix protein 2 [Vallitalea sp.]|uniref:serine/arginine repetitive matrix protein 2 n=1 Tax=Vallitalea sp. TaxID=1882829 RepID=UPI0025D71F42|nr:serine/arginine repetitive matrix protein 2 [Vallitalea sp.]MCT4687113.1 serine/arginine repetitive matrix protein 2 [Vallitalea sp.]